MNFKDKFHSVRPLFEVAKKYKPSKEVYPIGIWQFDNAMEGGVRNGELIIVSGQTGQGKTSYCQNITKNLDSVSVPTLWFSYEMDQWHLKEKFEDMGCNKDLLAYTPIELVSSTLSFLKAQIAEAKKEFACKVVFIDHLHYLIPLEKSVNTSLIIGGLIRNLKKMAIEMKIIIFLIAHTKKIYQDERLDLSSIRDSSLIAQESDYVFLVERLKKSDKKMESNMSEWTNKTKIQLAKNRRTGKLIPIEFNFENGVFIPIDPFLKE